MKQKRQLPLILFLTTLLIGCLHDSSSELMELPSGHFAMYLDSYPYANSTNDPQTADYVISDDDVIEYNWTQQIVTLSPELKNLFEADENFLQDHSRFTVTLDGETLYEGEVVFSLSARRLSTPVMFVLEERMYPGYMDEYSDYIDGDIYLSIHLQPQRYAFGKNAKIVPFPVDDFQVQEQLSDHFRSHKKLKE